MAKLTVADVPHMLKLWNRELNAEAPEDVSVYCTDKKFWICPDCRYAWSTAPKTRYRSSGKCPCHESNKVIKRGVNDVLTLVKGLEALLDDDNDFDKIYSQGVDSNLPVNFKCDECGRKWTVTLHSQVKKDGNGGYVAVGCPHYNTVKRKKSEVPFCTEVEAVIRFWDEKNPMDPATTRSNSVERAHFICKNCGYDWTTSIVEQTKGTGKCKCCELQAVTRKGITDVFTLIPEAKRYYDFNKNKGIDIYSISLRNAKTQIDWKCPDCGREWRSTLAQRVNGKKGEYSFRGCQECYFHDKERITPVASVPKLMKQWDFRKNKGMDPNLTSAYKDAPAHWRCKECGYEWVANISSRMNSAGTCPFCDGSPKAVIRGVNDVLTLCPEIGTIYDFERNAEKGIDIYKLGVNSKTKAHFKCEKCGNVWDSPINKRVKRNGDGTYRLVDCSVCSNEVFRKVPYSVEFPLLGKMYREDLNHIPLDSIRGSKAVSYTHYQWECPACGETFASTLNAMRESCQTPTKGCPYCSRTKLRKGESFAEMHPELMDEYDPGNTLDAYNVFPNCKDSAGWICRNCGHRWDATFALRHAGWGNCLVCNGAILDPDKNSLKALYPDVAQRWSANNVVGPERVFATSYEWFRWICDICSGEYGSRIKDVVNGTDECPYCKGTKVLPGFNSFAHNHPDLLKEMDIVANYMLPISPDEVSDDSSYKFWWICKSNPKHKYPMAPRTRLMFQKRDREPCLYCRGQRRKLQHFVSYNNKP